MSLFKKKSSDFDEQESQGSGKSRGSLVVLLVLLGGLAYLYFFTSLIVPHEAPIAKAPDLPVEVKQSLPPKPETQPAAPATADVKKPAEATPAAPTVPVAAKPMASPVPVPAAAKPAAPPAPASAAAKKVAPPAPAPVAAKPAAPAVAAKPPMAAKPAAVTPVITASAPVKKEAPKAAPVVQKKAVTKSAKAPASAAGKPAAANKTESYTLLAGVFSAGEEATAAEAKLVRLGIKPVTRNQTKKNVSMNRLFYGAYTDYDLYLAELDKLRKSAKGAFGIEKNGTYSLYAGSFSAKDSAEKEKRALAAKGVKLQIQQTVLALTTVKLTAGRFASKKEADKAAATVKGEGLAVKVVPTGR